MSNDSTQFTGKLKAALDKAEAHGWITPEDKGAILKNPVKCANIDIQELDDALAAAIDQIIDSKKFLWVVKRPVKLPSDSELRARRDAMIAAGPPVTLS